jgi:D-3-phosphoglycerate dehydrogenase
MSDICLVLQPIHAAGIERLRKAGCEVRLAASLAPADVARDIADARAVLTRDAPVRDALMAAAPRLAVIGVHGTGVDNVAVEAATARGIAVVNTPGANARSVAEHALALTFHLAKSIGGGDRAARQSDGSFKYRSSLVELEGATFGVIGFGAIGRATARLAKAFGMEVIGWSRSQDEAAFAADGVRRVPSLDDVLSESDVVSLHVPGGPATRGMIGRDQLARMKPNAYLINTARGALIDEAALAEALIAGRIAGAGLDVFAVEPLPESSPLIGLDNVVLTPHVGGSTEAAMYRAATTLADEVLAVLEGVRPDHLVNEAVWARIASGERAI